MNVRAKLLVLSVIFLIPGIGRGQAEDYDEDIQFHSQELDRLRSEIADFRKRIRKTAEREKSTSEKLSELDEEITLMRNLLYRLRKEEKAKRKAVENTKQEIAAKEAEHLELQSEIDAKETEYAELEDRYARRIVHVYKKGRLSDLELLLDSDSWGQAVYRSKYLKIISDYDRALASELQKKIDEITVLAAQLQKTIGEIKTRQKTLEGDLKDLEKIDREKSSRKAWLERSRRERTRELANFKRDRQQLTRALEERQAAAKEMERIIARLEREKAARLAELERRRKEEKLLAAGDFATLKGSLPWPVEGKITSRFGSRKNPTLNTITENTGIDIKGSPGGPVRAVFSGIVTTVTYIRGYGNTIIIDHGGGFYTVYTHVTDVEIEENAYVRAREVIAHVGDSGSYEGAKLHFEIWSNRQKLNPESWLRKG